MIEHVSVSGIAKTIRSFRWERWLERPYGTFVLSLFGGGNSRAAMRRFGVDAEHRSCLFQNGWWLESRDVTVPYAEELKRYLKRGVRPRTETVKPCELFGIVNSRFVLFRDKASARRFFKKTVGKRSSRNRREIRGAIACQGRARGVVRIVMVPEDCRKVKRGDILVSNMTHQDYLPGMVKAAAIVTDEGGISCHAAIVSRELNKPCVIGTKIATEVFKNGDRVEVDANKGIVRKL